MIVRRRIVSAPKIDYRNRLDNLRNETAIKVGQIECVRSYYQRGFPLKTMVKSLKNNTITVYDFQRLSRHIEKMAARPFEEYHG